MNPMDEITLTGLRATGFHGVLDEERRTGQQFVIDVTVFLELGAAARTDDLALTVDYGELAAEIVAAVERDPVDLIETLAERVAQLVLGHSRARLARVTVHKPDAPIAVPFEDVSVTVTRERELSVHPVGFSTAPEGGR